MPGFVDHAQVAGFEKAVCIKGFAGALGVFQVFAHHIALDPNFTDFTNRAFGFGGGVHNARLHALQGLSHAVQAQFQGIIGIGHGAIAIGFGQAVNIANVAQAHVDQALNLQGRTNGGTPSQRLKPVGMKLGVVEQGLGHVGGAVKQGAALGLNQVKGLDRVKVFLQNNAATVGE